MNHQNWMGLFTENEKFDNQTKLKHIRHVFHTHCDKIGLCAIFDHLHIAYQSKKKQGKAMSLE